MKNTNLACMDCSKEDVCKYKVAFGHAVTAIMDANVGYAEVCAAGHEPAEKLRDNDFISVDIKCKYWSKQVALTRDLSAAMG